MLILTQATLLNPGVLHTRSLPKKIFGRVMVFPRGAGLRLWLRLAVEIQLLRYLVTLLPFILTPLFAPNLALPVMEAPALMLILVGLVELRVLRLSKAARARATDADTSARRLDALTFRARTALRAIAARHRLTEGTLRLVVEQSPLARIAPLTLVSVQTDRPGPRVMALDAADRAALGALFDATLTEADLLAVNHRDGTYLRDIAQEAGAVSAQSRLAAWIDRRAAE